MNNKENFKEKFLELMSQQVTLDAIKDQTLNLDEDEKEEQPLENVDIQEILKQKLKEKLQEKNTLPQVNDEKIVLPEFSEVQRSLNKEEDTLKEQNELPKVKESNDNLYLIKEQEIPLMKITINKEPALQELSVISQETSINGTIETKGHIELKGKIQGNISAVGDVKVFGNLTGNLISLGTVHINQGAVVNGNTTAEQMVVEGTINGDIIVTKEIQLLKRTIMNGSLISGDLTMHQGAKLSGLVRIGENK